MRRPRALPAGTTSARLSALVLCGVLLGGCGGGGRVDASRAGQDLPDCSADGCAAELAAYSDAVGSLADVQSVDLAYEAQQITNVASVTGDVHVTRGAVCADLEDDLGRLLWQSQLPVPTVTLSCYLPGASGSDYDYATSSFLLQDVDDLTAKWGPRGG